MPTSTFDRKIEISDPEALRRLIAIMAKDAPKAPLSDHPYSEAEREKSEELLRRFLERVRQKGD